MGGHVNSSTDSHLSFLAFLDAEAISEYVLHFSRLTPPVLISEETQGRAIEMSIYMSRQLLPMSYSQALVRTDDELEGARYLLMLTVMMPNRLGNFRTIDYLVKFYQSRAIDGKIKNATVTQSAGHWYVSLQVELDIGEPKHRSTSSIGIDMGINKYVALSTGSYEDPIHPFKKHQDKLAQAQRRLSRKKKFSGNWKKQKKRIQNIHSKIAHVCKDF